MGTSRRLFGTTMAMIEQGTRVMSAVHKRLHYAIAVGVQDSGPGDERVFCPRSIPTLLRGADGSVMAEDFDDRVDVIPVSNPNTFSQSQRILLAQTKLQLAAQAPDMHNMPEVFRDMYEALGVTDVDRLMKSVPEDEPRPTDPAKENIDALDNIQLKAFEGQNHQAHINGALGLWVFWHGGADAGGGYFFAEARDGTRADRGPGAGGAAGCPDAANAS